MKKIVVGCLALVILSAAITAGAAATPLPARVLNGQDSALERAALMRLYETTAGDAWYENEGWGGTGSYCTWYGITCDFANQVILLDLQANNLFGPIPPQIDDLVELQWLQLDGNSMTGPLPDELGDLAQLNVLSLSYNEVCIKGCGRTLGGPIPASLGKLSNLQVLDLSGNSLEGAIPPQLGQLSQLLTLDLSNNAYCRPSYLFPDQIECFGGLAGSIPAALSDLAALLELNLQGNKSLCWETEAAKSWALMLPLYSGPTDCLYMPVLQGDGRYRLPNLLDRWPAACGALHTPICPFPAAAVKSAPHQELYR